MHFSHIASVTGLYTPSLRLGVTGLSRAGKTVFITSLVRNLVSGGRLPFFSAQAEGRLASAYLQPQPDDAVPRFDYEAHLAALGGHAARVAAQHAPHLRAPRRAHRSPPTAGCAAWPAIAQLNLDIVDYPGEWLLDLAMLDQSYAAWSEEALACSACARAQGFRRGVSCSS